MSLTVCSTSLPMNPRMSPEASWSSTAARPLNSRSACQTVGEILERGIVAGVHAPCHGANHLRQSGLAPKPAVQFWFGGIRPLGHAGLVVKRFQIVDAIADELGHWHTR